MMNLLNKNQGQILNLFFKDPDKEYHLRGIARHLGKEPGYFQKAINNLVKAGILKDERKANLRFFKLNKGYPLYEEIKKIVSKTLGIEAKLKDLANSLKGIKCAFIFGSIAKGKEYSESDIDLMLIGEVDQDDLTKKVSQLENELNREINYHIISQQELVDKISNKNSFIGRILNEAKIILKGNLDEFTKIN